MHEFTIATNIIENINQSLSTKPIIQIAKIYLSIGKLSGVSIPALEYSFQFMDKPPIYQNSKLIINEIPIVINCFNCNKTTQIEDDFVLQCQWCYKLSSQIISGKELKIDKIEIDYE